MSMMPPALMSQPVTRPAMPAMAPPASAMPAALPMSPESAMPGAVAAAAMKFGCASDDATHFKGAMVRTAAKSALKTPVRK